MGREFDNSSFHKFAIDNGLIFRFSFPQTSSQNGKAERMLRRLNKIILALLFHASLPPNFWVDALHTATYLHNILPSSLINFRSPSSFLFLKIPPYDQLRVFGCLCYPNLSAKRTHKLQIRSTRCVFLGYPVNYPCYHSLDLSTGKIILFRHVTFDESVFPYASPQTQQPTSYSFLNPDPASLSPAFLDHFNPTPYQPANNVNAPASPSTTNTPSSPAHTPLPPPLHHPLLVPTQAPPSRQHPHHLHPHLPVLLTP